MAADKAKGGILQKTASADVAAHLARIQSKGSLKQASNAARVAQDVDKMKISSFVFYSVPPMSENQYLPDAYPMDGSAMESVKIIAAGDEFEPGSFVIYPLKDLGKVSLCLTPFKTKDGKVFPANKLDLKVVKVWYQNRNGWYSYFGDTELKLTPELLLNDEDLVKVDTKEVQNYAKLVEKDGRVHYQWITPPEEFDSRDDHYARASIFTPMKENFRDADTIQPVLLEEGAFKQIFLTAHVEKNQPAGIYHGAVELKAKNGAMIGQIPVVLRVLPFQLPAPKAYYDVTKDYLNNSYNYTSYDLIMVENGGNRELAEKQYFATLKNLAEHNQTIFWIRDGEVGKDSILKMVDMMKRAGIRTDKLVGGTNIAWMEPDANYLSYSYDAKLKREWIKKYLNDAELFIGYSDEPGTDECMTMRKHMTPYQEQRLKFIIAGGDGVLYKLGYSYDFFNNAKDPELREHPRPWNEIGHAYVAWYAAQHVGPEDPAFNRRQYGLAPYLAGYSANCNYAHHYGPWNDRHCGYKPMVFAYGISNGVVDTLAWEGFREGVDDIRYATLMKTLALEAAKSTDITIRNAGTQALQFLALENPDSIDLNSARLEMIRHILKLKQILKK